MCDTMVALGNSTADGSVLFAKNSDRDPNEAHHILILPEKNNPVGSTVKCTYIEVPQVPHSYAVLLAKPFWIWGAEMGANEKGVVIGNEAVFSKQSYGKEPGLIGMDFLRLALERADTASKAMHTIIALLEEYDQSGNCGFSHPLYYHNSFLIVDRHEAWVLETSGKHWIAEKVHDVRSISNVYTIHTKYDLASAGLIDYAVDQGWCKDRHQFDFSRSFSDFIYTTFSAGCRRHQCSSSWLESQKGKITEKIMMAILRSHGVNYGDNNASFWSPDRAIMGQDICAHAGFGPIRISQSTGSMVSKLTQPLDTHWITATSAPCTSIFKPIWIDSGFSDMQVTPTGIYDEASIWWQHELLHREILRGYGVRAAFFLEERNHLENEFIAKSNVRMNVSERRKVSDECFRTAREADQRWLYQLRSIKNSRSMRFYHAMAWRRINQKGKIPIHY